jgi:hypothetical protein
MGISGFQTHDGRCYLPGLYIGVGSRLACRYCREGDLAEGLRTVDSSSAACLIGGRDEVLVSYLSGMGKRDREWVPDLRIDGRLSI